mmetsp:Transcript_34950/g.100553  ORF Transcript_34950/g.100553 Transcript_34950/m.100553 type:complete len:133 (+) Transcript_34950:841-1239(+)
MCCDRSGRGGDGCCGKYWRWCRQLFFFSSCCKRRNQTTAEVVDRHTGPRSAAFIAPSRAQSDRTGTSPSTARPPAVDFPPSHPLQAALNKFPSWSGRQQVTHGRHAASDTAREEGTLVESKASGRGQGGRAC